MNRGQNINQIRVYRTATFLKILFFQEDLAPKEEEEEEEEEERLGTHCTGGWVGPTAGLDRCGKSRPPPGFDPRTVQPVANRYTNYTIRPVNFTRVDV